MKKMILGSILVALYALPSYAGNLAKGQCSIQKTPANSTTVLNLAQNKPFEIDLLAEGKAKSTVSLGSYDGLHFEMISPATITIPMLQLSISSGSKVISGTMRETALDRQSIFVHLFTNAAGD